MGRHVIYLLVPAVFAGAGLFGCAKDAADEAADADSLAAADSAAHYEALAQLVLYDRLGGAMAITVVVDDFVARAAADDTLNFTRQGTANAWDATPANIDTLKARLVQFIGSATGGQEMYEGQDMGTVHAGMAITDAEFDRADLLAVVETTRSAIVQPAP
ncbi:MAG: group 1 truncated hemoglobin [Gemmatimonadota bacterium]